MRAEGEKRLLPTTEFLPRVIQNRNIDQKEPPLSCSCGSVMKILD
jgi:hypothetical protein